MNYYAAGFNVIPLRPNSKIPLVPWESFQSQRVNPATIKTWWNEHRNAGIAALMGNISGNIIAVDIDPRNGGLESQKIIDLPETLTHKTGGSGFHYFYHMPMSHRKKIGVYPGIDLIGEGGYCVMPPSMHSSGQRYEILLARLISPAPKWLIDICDADNVPVEAKRIPVGERHDSIVHSIRGYAANTKHSFILLWKRAYWLVLKCAEPSPRHPVTFSELFHICLWAWNISHPYNRLAHAVAWKMLSGRCANGGDIVFGPATSSIHTFHLKQITPQQLNLSTSQSNTVIYPRRILCQ